MSLVPKKQLEKVAFFKDHLAQWQANSTAIGVSTGAVTALSALVTAAETALSDKGIALTAAKSAVDNADMAIDAMAKSGADIISAIRTKARTGGDSVYTLAGIPVPATPSHRAVPGTPTGFTAGLTEDGALHLAWKCPNPEGASGTVYQVFRRTATTAPWDYIAGVGTRKFVDDSIPVGATTVFYQVQAVRSTVVGPWGRFQVSFGAGEGGMVTATLGEQSPKLAA